MRLIALLCCFLAASLASAKDFKLAVVDMQKLFNAYPGTQKAKDKLTNLEKKKKEDLTDSAQELSDLEKDLSSSNSVLSESQKKRKAKEYKEKLDAFKVAQESAQKELMGKETEMTQSIVEDIKAVVAGVAKDNGVDLVLDQDKTVYAKDAEDLTDAVLKSFKKSGQADDSK